MMSPQPPPQQQQQSQPSQPEATPASTPQLVTKLPPILAEDLILKNLLQTTNQDENLEKFKDNVIPLKINYSGLEQKKEINGKLVTITDAHKDKQVMWDPEKGFVSTNWSYFEVDPSKQQQQEGQFITDDPNGVFIKHLASTILTPKQIGENSKILSSIDMKSLAFTSANLGSNAWSNVLLYKPKEQIFQLDPQSNVMMKKLEPQQQQGGQPTQEQPLTATDSTGSIPASSDSTSSF